MPFEHHWLVDGRVMYTRFYGDIVIEELDEAVLMQVTAMDSVNGDFVHSITDASDAESYPTRIGELRRSLKPLLNHDKLDWVIVFGNPNPMIRFMADLLGQISGNKFRYFGDSQAAFDFLRTMDNSLPSLSRAEKEDEDS